MLHRTKNVVSRMVFLFLYNNCSSIPLYIRIVYKATAAETTIILIISIFIAEGHGVVLPEYYKPPLEREKACFMFLQIVGVIVARQVVATSRHQTNASNQ